MLVIEGVQWLYFKEDFMRRAKEDVSAPFHKNVFHSESYSSFTSGFLPNNVSPEGHAFSCITDK